MVAAHPDDEVLGCGGAIARHVNNGDQVNILVLADGVSSRYGTTGQLTATTSVREANAKSAAEILGVKNIFFQRLPDNRLDSIDFLEIVQKIEFYVEKISPNIIYTHHFGDLNIDHRLAHQAVMTACRPQPNFPVSSILCFEIPSSTEWQTPSSCTHFIPDVFIDITPYVKLKHQALQQYANEIRKFPHPRSFESIESLNIWRGSSVGVRSAEAFCLSRHIIR